MSPALAQFCTFFREFNAASLADIAHVYSANAVFQDPVHHIVGREKIARYFARLLFNTSQCQFSIDTVIEQHNCAFVSWILRFSHPRLKAERRIEVSGASHLQFSERIDYHRDYFDLGQMLYEQLPLLGAIIRHIKSRLAV